MPPRRIYLLSPKQFSPETIAVTFAKTSRSPETFQAIASGLTNQDSAEFHEKWVVGYGHSSVAEHAVLHIAMENVSRLAVESIESNRLASYTEKSTRYQKWNREDFCLPPELEEHPMRDDLVRTCRMLFDTYLASLEPVRALVEMQNPRRRNEDDEAFDRRIRSQYVDSCRFLLPAASLANLGMTANARVLENAISKLLSHPLAEVRLIGEEVRKVAQMEVPTLVKYADVNRYLLETPVELNRLGPKRMGTGRLDWCTLVNYDPAGESRVLAAALYRHGGMSYEGTLAYIHTAPQMERERVAQTLLGTLDRHQVPLRELEHTAYTFDMVLDQGAYAEFKRHRMMSQSPQALTSRLGYAVPRRLIEAGFESRYRAAMNAASATYEKLAIWNPAVASYVIPNGFNRRILFTMNLREAFAFCQLRSAANAHFSIRRIALRVAEEIRRVHPLLGRYFSLPEGETWQDIDRKNFY